MQSGSDIYITAKNVEINALEDYFRYQEEIKKRGFYSGSSPGESSVGISFGYGSEKHKTDEESKVAISSGLFADGSVFVTAEDNFLSEAATFVVGHDLVVDAGGDIIIESALDYLKYRESDKILRVGFDLTIQEHVTPVLKTLANTPEALSSGEGGTPNQVITATSASLQAVDAAYNLIMARWFLQI